MKPNIKTENYKPKVHESYSVEEVLAAGGTTAFGIKTGKTSESLIKALESAPKAERTTKEELKEMLDQLAREK